MRRGMIIQNSRFYINVSWKIFANRAGKEEPCLEQLIIFYSMRE